MSFVRLRCLIVDDSKEFLASATQLLGSQGLEMVGSASSAAEALRLTETLEPEVVLVDIELGDDDGIELTRQLASRAPATRVVLISAHEREELSELISDSPAVGFLPKSALGAPAIVGLVRTSA